MAAVLSEWGLPPVRVPAIKWDSSLPRSVLSYVLSRAGVQVRRMPGGTEAWQWVRSRLRVVSTPMPSAAGVRWNHIRSCRHAEVRWCLEPGATVPRVGELDFGSARRSKYYWKFPLPQEPWDKRVAAEKAIREWMRQTRLGFVRPANAALRGCP